jgi:hypothetical protein
MIPRRAALERLSLLLGGALSSQLTAGLMGQVLNQGPCVLASPEQAALLAELADTIIPTTSTPGAKAAGVQNFIVRVMRDCFALADQEAFYAGVANVDDASRKAYAKPFVDLTPPDRAEIVREIALHETAFFIRLRELTVTGYFTSEIGATQALEFLPIPGRFEGDVPMQPNQKAWAISK